MELERNVVDVAYVMIHTEMCGSAEYHIQRARKIVEQAITEKRIALIEMPFLPRPRTLEQVRRSTCSPSLTNESTYWKSIEALNQFERDAAKILGKRFFICDDLCEIERDSKSPQAKKVVEELSTRLNIEPRVLNEYEPCAKYLFTRIICFGESPGSCVRVYAKSLEKIAVHTSG